MYFYLIIFILSALIIGGVAYYISNDLLTSVLCGLILSVLCTGGVYYYYNRSLPKIEQEEIFLNEDFED